MSAHLCPDPALGDAIGQSSVPRGPGAWPRDTSQTWVGLQSGAFHHGAEPLPLLFHPRCPCGLKASDDDVGRVWRSVCSRDAVLSVARTTSPICGTVPTLQTWDLRPGRRGTSAAAG